MNNDYTGVVTRFLRKDERLIVSEEEEMPFVIEATGSTDVDFLQTFIRSHSSQLKNDIAKYGAVLLRGFDVHSEAAFENTVLSVQGLQGISDAFMSEEGRIHVGDLKYVLHTNAVYKTGGTVYLGGFHGENYYSPDVPGYICFWCHQPSQVGGETGLINTAKIYQHLNKSLIEKLEKQSFFVSKWLLSEAAARYQVPAETIEDICKQFDLPIVGQGDERFILMYKPSVFEHPMTKKKALQINYFELPTLNAALRKHFMHDYQGKTWFWHRFFWRMPMFVLRPLELFYMMFASFFHSPKNAMNILRTKHAVRQADKKAGSYNKTKVGSCFNEQDVEELAKLMRKYYSSCLWKKGDILLVDNRQVAHAGMPGEGPRLVRAMICNPLEMRYSSAQSGVIDCRKRAHETIGYYVAKQQMPMPEGESNIRFN